MRQTIARLRLQGSYHEIEVAALRGSALVASSECVWRLVLRLNRIPLFWVLGQRGGELIHFGCLCLDLVNLQERLNLPLNVRDGLPGRRRLRGLAASGALACKFQVDLSVKPLDLLLHVFIAI